jgi:hypothetical protein
VILYIQVETYICPRRSRLCHFTDGKRQAKIIDRAGAPRLIRFG